MSNILKIADLTDHAIRAPSLPCLTDLPPRIAPTGKEMIACRSRTLPAWACHRSGGTRREA
jgi:hypothetical protein